MLHSAARRKLELVQQRFGERILGKADGCTMAIAVRRMQDPEEATRAASVLRRPSSVSGLASWRPLPGVGRLLDAWRGD